MTYYSVIIKNKPLMKSNKINDLKNFILKFKVRHKRIYTT